MPNRFNINRFSNNVTAGHDRKWELLSSILQHDERMHDARGRQRKLIIFSEHRDTLNYLHRTITGVVGNPDAVSLRRRSRIGVWASHRRRRYFDSFSVTKAIVRPVGLSRY
jgi:hypothetical protein